MSGRCVGFFDTELTLPMVMVMCIMQELVFAPLGVMLIGE